MNVLFVVSECASLLKTGGLADVAGALPVALAAQGCSVRVLMPAYRGLAERLKGARQVLAVDSLFGGPAGVLAGKVGELDIMLLEAPHLYDRDGSAYIDASGKDWPDNAERFAALCQVAAAIANGRSDDGWSPAVVHAHDWQAGLVPVYLSGTSGRPATVFTIHNIAYQGIFARSMLAPLELPPSSYSYDGLEYYGQISFLKAGLVYSDALTTVSPTYARELTTAEFGMGLEGVISGRADRFTGILNGIDLVEWDPARDPHIEPFSTRRMSARAANKTRLADAFGLPADPQAPLFGVVSRLTPQKGFDLLISALPRLIELGGQLVVLGSGDRELETAFKAAAETHPQQVGVRIGYDEPLSHLVYAGSDALLVPSRFEPCGLTQLYALRYGAIPVVARTGGLADTVIDANIAALNARVATGIHFPAGSAAGFADAIGRTCAHFADKRVWRQMQRNAMRQPVGWDSSANDYIHLYQQLTEQ